MAKIFIGSVFLVGGALWEVLNQWSLVDAVLTKSRNEGVAGIFIAGVLISPVFRLVLILFGLGIVAKGYSENRALRRHSTDVGTTSDNSKQKASRRQHTTIRQRSLNIAAQHPQFWWVQQDDHQGFVGGGKWMAIALPFCNEPLSWRKIDTVWTCPHF